MPSYLAVGIQKNIRPFLTSQLNSTHTPLILSPHQHHSQSLCKERGRERESTVQDPFSSTLSPPASATAAPAGAEGESRTARLPSFLSSVLTSIFGQGKLEEDQQEPMNSTHQPPVLHHNRGKGGPALGKSKACAGADGQNRRVLGDIGNVVDLRPVEGKLLPQIPRPVTRSSGTQLLAKPLEGGTVLVAADKKPAVEPVDGAVPRGRGRAASKQKVTFKPIPETIIENSSHTNEKMEQASAICLSSSSRKPSRKKVHTFTSVLTARSKAACCGITSKLKDLVLDIDASDHNDQLAVVDYVEDIYEFYKLSESSNRPLDYIRSQVEINEKMRAILADWLIEVHHKFELMPETLYLTFYVIDQYLSMVSVPRRELQLVGVSAMLIACKYEEIWAPEVKDFMCISDMAYTRDQILAKEKGILNRLEWNLTVPTPYVFLVRFLKAALCDKEMEYMAFFFAELGLMEYSMTRHRPSIVAAAAVYAARCTLQKTPLWTETLKSHTGFSEPQLWECARVLVKCHSAAPESKLKVVYKKYSSPKLGAVALHPPATELLSLEMVG